MKDAAKNSAISYNHQNISMVQEQNKYVPTPTNDDI